MSGWLKNLLKDSMVYGIGIGISRFLQIIILPVIAHSLTLAEYGYYSNYVIFYTVAVGMLMLGIDSSVARFMFDSEQKSYQRKIFSISFFCLLLVGILFACICSLFPASVITLINVPVRYEDTFVYVLLIVPCMLMNNFFQAWFKWKRQKIYFLVNTVGTVFFLLLPLLSADKITLPYIFRTILFSHVIVMIISTLLVREFIRPVFDSRLFVALLKYGFPWMLVYFFGLSRIYLDRFFLTHYLTDDVYGAYNFSIRLASFLTLITTAFDMSFGPFAFSIWKKDNAPEFFARIQSAYVFLIGTIACFITILSPVLVNLLGGEKFHGAEEILPYLMFAGIPLSLINFSSLGVNYAKKSFLSTVTLAAGFSVVLVLNTLFTPRFLQFGAVNASLVGHLCIIACGYFLSQRYYKINFHYAKDGILFLSLLGLSVLFSKIHFNSNLFQDITIKMLTLAAIAMFVLIIAFQPEYKKITSMLKNMRYTTVRSNANV